MAHSTYEIPCRDTREFQARDGQWYETERKARQINAKLAIMEIAEEGSWQGVVTAADVSDFIIENLSALAPWLDDLNG